MKTIVSDVKNIKEEVVSFAGMIEDYFEREYLITDLAIVSTMKFKVKSICDLLGVSRSTFYDWDCERSFVGVFNYLYNHRPEDLKAYKAYISELATPVKLDTNTNAFRKDRLEVIK